MECFLRVWLANVAGMASLRPSCLADLNWIRMERKTFRKLKKKKNLALRLYNSNRMVPVG
jgi:hypothetical protein